VNNLSDSGRNHEDDNISHILEEPHIKLKKSQAINTINMCLGPKGFSASGGLSHYNYQYWTRDMCYSFPALNMLGLTYNAKQQIDQIIRFIKNGQVPTLFFEFPRRFSSSPKFTDQLDNELLMINLLQHLKMDDFIQKIWKYVESQIGKDGFLYGRDWRDGMSIYKNKASLHNQVLLYHVYQKEKKEEFKKRVFEKFWLEDKNHYADWISKEGNRSSHLDVLGHAMALIHDFIPESRIKTIEKSIAGASTKYGYVNIYPRYPCYDCSWWGLIPKNLYQNGGIWGLVQGHMILALLHLNQIDKAVDQFWIMTKWRGFNEWYDPKTGKPKGSRNQLWTAALWLMCYQEFFERSRQIT
jgi:hypothetical protein